MVFPTLSHSIFRRVVVGMVTSTVLCVISAGATMQSDPTARDKARRRIAQKTGEQAGEGSPVKSRRPLARISGRPSDKSNAQLASLESSKIDARLDKEIEKAGREQAPKTEDGDFLRRVCLDLTGKLPAPDKLDAFLRDPDPSKRARVIDELLNTEDYCRNWARYWRDVIAFHALDRRAVLAARNFEDWLAEQLQKNVPWDKVATELITAKGPIDEDGRTYLIFAQFDGAPENTAGNLAAEVSRVFLGIQIQCAQCHDHPYDDWKREQFHEMAAFFARTNVRRQAQGEPRFEVIATDERSMGPAPKLRRTPLEHQMPDKDEPDRKHTVHPHFLLGQSPPQGLSDANRRALFAQFVTDRDDPWFARAYVNRIWGELMGEGFYQPIDDLGPRRNSRYPAVMEQLASSWQASGYDPKWLLRVIMNTEAYQREIRPRDPSAEHTPFAAVCASRLSGDQIYDALIQALGIDERAISRGAAAAGPQPKRLGAFSPRTLFNTQFGIDPSTPIDDVQGTIPQALFMMNSPLVSSQMRAQGDTLLGRLISVYEDDEELVRLLYRRVLARSPSDEELRTCKAYIEEVGRRGEAFEDLLWSLVNSTEFITKR